MVWLPLDTWIVVTGVISAMACALVGNFLVLRRMSMMGDAISHAVLPGLAAAFLLTASRQSLPMFIGAALVGVLTAVFTQWIHSQGRVEQSAAMGVTFTTLFALGLVMIEQGARHVDLDTRCVLYGAIELVPLDTMSLAGFAVPRASAWLGVTLALNAAFVLLFYKELKISAFDPQLATALGINARAMHYSLMTLVAVTTVAAFEAVGSILVIAMLIVPAAAAHLLTDRLHTMIIVSLVIAAVCAALGHLVAITVPPWFGFQDTNTAGMMAAVAGAVFAVVMLGAPRHGVVSKLVHRAALSAKILQEDVLALLYRLEELNRAGIGTVSPAFVANAIGAGRWRVRLALWRLARAGKLAGGDGGHALAEAGRAEARQLVRTHRLWESYLHRVLNLPADHVHAPAERLEHATTPAMREQLAASTGQPQRDPHGKHVPG
jgi:manganese/zinc/iron transport system permease protein